MKCFFLFLVLLISVSSFALEVDEKLTVRIVKLSDSKKTLMINRGTEDGLVEGDHAKFIISSGIVGRGLIVKISPTRSVWAIYRLVNADLIVNDAVLTIKITSPVKLTNDESKSLVQDDTPSATGNGELGIPLAEGAQDLVSSEATASDIKAMSEGTIDISLVDKTKEVIGNLNISGLSANTKLETGSDSYSGSFSSHHIGLLGEIYPQREREWYSKFSIIGGINLMRLNAISYNGSSSTNDVTELYLGTNWHPFKKSGKVLEFIPYFNLGFGMGTVKSGYTPGARSVDEAVSTVGSSSSFNLGFGYKYYLPSGFGARIFLDYYSRTDTFKEDSFTDKFVRLATGPRLMVGLTYRF